MAKTAADALQEIIQKEFSTYNVNLSKNSSQTMYEIWFTDGDGITFTYEDRDVNASLEVNVTIDMVTEKTFYHYNLTYDDTYEFVGKVASYVHDCAYDGFSEESLFYLHSNIKKLSQNFYLNMRGHFIHQ